MAPTKHINVAIFKMPSEHERSPSHTKPRPIVRPGFMRSESTLVAQEIGDTTTKSNMENLPKLEAGQESKPENFKDYNIQETGKLASWRGSLIIFITGGAMFMDNVFMTSTNISLSAIQEEFDVLSSNLQWMLSAYTLSFGGTLLLSGALSDRYGRKLMFIFGLVWLSLWTLAIGFGSSFVEVTVFRGLQGMGASLTIPSAVGIISSYFTGPERTRALGIYAASGAVGFTFGLVLGGLLSSSLGWRYIFRLSLIASGILAILGVIVLPAESSKTKSQVKMDYFGASLSTAGLILLAFVLSGGGIYGWGRPWIIVLLTLPVCLLIAFVYYEHKIDNPIMPLSLWKIRNFPSIWIVGFTANGSFTAVLYYTVLMAQQVDNLSALDTALRYIPSGILGFVITLITTKFMEFVDGKYILISGLVISVLAPIPGCLLSDTTNFWANVMSTSFISVTGISICYVTASTLMLNSAPMDVKSLCGGMINTAYQIGGGVTLAICSAIVQVVDIDKGHNTAQQFSTGLWVTSGISGVGLLVAIFWLKNDHSASGHEAKPS